MIEKLKTYKLFAYLYAENPDYKFQRLFVDSFMVINALKGISNLVVASLTEDEYGIVQQTLCEIITLFIDLQKVFKQFYFSEAKNQKLILLIQKFRHSKDSIQINCRSDNFKRQMPKPVSCTFRSLSLS